MKNIDRRSFIRTGVAGAAGMAVLPASIDSSPIGGQGQIITRTLGSTGMVVPVISFGVMKADNQNLCKAAYEKGIKLFDTANRYQNGNNEMMLGNLFRNYPRDSFYLSTKVKPDMNNDGKPTAQTSADDFLSMFSISLKRLKMDYVDILYIHDVRHTDMLEFKPIVNAIKRIKKEGKAKFIGFSTHTNEANVINAAAELDVFDVILTSYNFMQTYADELTAAIAKAAKAGIGIVAMKTMAGGGFLDKNRTKAINTSAAIKWVLSNPNVTTTIPGMTEFDHLDSDIKLMTDIELTDTERKDLVAARSEIGLYCTGCTECLKQCPLNVPVNDLMRAYMYAYGYSNTKMANELLGELKIKSDPCRDCSQCTVNCTKKFNVREKIADISRLATVPSDFLV